MHSEASAAPTPRNGLSNFGRYAGAKPPPRPKLATHPIRAANALECKYRETLGEIKKLEMAEYEWTDRIGYEDAEKWWRDRLKQLLSTLASLERSIRLFDPKWQRKSLMIPILKQRTRPLLPKGAFQRALVEVMRDAKEPLLASEIAMRIASQLGLPIRLHDQRLRLSRMALSSLRSFQSKGRVGFMGSPAKWFAVPSTSQAEGALFLR